MSDAEPVAVTLVVGDRALCTLVARATERAAGVVRLQPSPRQAARHTARRLAGRAPRGAIAAVDLDRDADAVTVTVRITVDISAAVQHIVAGVQEQVADELARMAGLTAIVIVHVLDVRTSARR